jgi:hypothetical protein
MATEQINDAIANLDGGDVNYLEVIYPDTLMFQYNTESTYDSNKFKLLRIASDPDMATEQINDAIEALGDVGIGDVYGIYPDTVIISYNPSYKGSTNYRVKVVRIASDPDIATEQINDAISDIYESYEVNNLYTYLLYSDTLLYIYDYDD